MRVSPVQRAVGVCTDLPAQQLAREIPAPAVPGDKTVVTPVGNLPPGLAEASGLVFSRHHDVMWIHNDSEHSPTLYAVRPSGELVATVELDAGHYDWEDIARVDIGDRSYLAVCDVGDNDRERDTCVIHLFAEPDPCAGNRTVRPLTSITFRYQDGPHDVEAVAADGDRLLLLTKRDQPPILFELPLQRGGDYVHVARRLGSVQSIPPPPISVVGARGKNWKNQPTAMDIDPSGRRLVVLTYTQLCLYERRGGESWMEALRRQPEMLPLPLAQPQAEAVGFSRDGRALYVTSEGRGAPIHRIELRR